MSLRARLLALFLGLGVVPILLSGILGYVRSMRAVRGLLEAQTSLLAHQTASELAARYQLRLPELLLLAENAETQRLYQAHSDGTSVPLDSALSQAEDYLTEAWARFGGSYQRIELQDMDGRRVFTLGDSPPGTPPGFPMGGGIGESSPAARLSIPVQDLESGERIGTLEAAVHLRTVLPGEALDAAFGSAGYTVVVDRSEGEILHHPSRRFVHQPSSTLLGPGAWDVDPGALASDSGSFTFQEADAQRVASFVSLSDPPWTVITTASLEEFAPPFRGARTGNLLIVLLLAALVGAAFLVTTRQATASLEALTEASERMGRGDLDPPLPPAGPDEVGKLSAAFGLMVGQVREMLRRVEDTRHMAVMGELASSVSHQIRNPLTSIKLNLQGLEEETEAGEISDTSLRSLRICLREVAHLEAAVRKILDLARTHPPSRVETSLHGIIREAVELLESGFRARGVEVDLGLDAPHDTVPADPEELKSVFVNLLVNAQEAMPGGGTVFITTENDAGPETGGTIRVRVRDEGPGVPEGIREQIFRPFVTSKPQGTGFGLAIARLAVQEHHGQIRLESGGESEPDWGPGQAGSGGPRGEGATFLVDLPLTKPPRGLENQSDDRTEPSATGTQADGEGNP